MRICFPTEKLQGLDSQVYAHFGSAPGFVIVDTESGDIEQINNTDQHHAHGMCQPMKALGGKQVDAVVVGGIGMGALAKLKEQGVLVYRAVQGTVAQNTALLLDRKLPEFDPGFTCAGHTGGECTHH